MAKVPSAESAAKGDAFAELSAEYAQATRPLIKQFCLECHSTAKQEGELDLEQFAELARRPPRHEGLAEGRRDARQRRDAAEGRQAALAPSSGKQLRGWVERYLHAEALASAGDPGPVVLRRLSNAEYTYTIRDLTGVDRSIRPASSRSTARRAKGSRTRATRS